MPVKQLGRWTVELRSKRLATLLYMALALIASSARANDVDPVNAESSAISDAFSEEKPAALLPAQTSALAPEPSSEMSASEVAESSTSVPNVIDTQAEQDTAQPAPTPTTATATASSPLAGWGGPEQWMSPGGLSNSLQTMILLSVVSLAPAVLLMTTSFVRIIIVLGLLRQALGTQQAPPNQVTTSLAMFLTLLLMWPVWTRVYDDAIKPYTEHQIKAEEAWSAGIQPVRRFMSAQIDRTGNSDDIWLFYKYLPNGTATPTSYDDVPLAVLLPAFMLSELKTAFLIGFQVFLPFLVLDMVVSSVLVSMGMLMLPPALVSLPFKLLLFVLVDGWHLVVGMLLESFQPFV